MKLSEFVETFQPGEFGNYIEVCSLKLDTIRAYGDTTALPDVLKNDELSVYAGNISAFKRSKTYKAIKDCKVLSFRTMVMDATNLGDGCYVDKRLGEVYTDRYGIALSLDKVPKSITTLPTKKGGMSNIHAFKTEYDELYTMHIPVLEVVIDDTDIPITFHDYCAYLQK